MASAELSVSSRGEVEQRDPRALAVLAAMEKAAKEHIDAARPENTTRAYRNDWNLWEEFHGWLAEQTGVPLELTDATKGTFVGFVVWLDQVKEATPSSIDRRITGVTVTLRREHDLEVPKAVTLAAREALKPMKHDEERTARGRGQAPAITPEQLHAMSAATPANLTGIRDRALFLLAFGIAGRSAEVAGLRAENISLKGNGLEVKVPSVKGRDSRKVAVARAKNPDVCPVRAWLTWRSAAGVEAGPAFRPVDRWGNVLDRHLNPDTVRDIIGARAGSAGIEGRLTGHSMRAGFITTSRLAGKRVEKIREQSGHTESSPVFWRYIRDADLWVDAASEGIL